MMRLDEIIAITVHTYHGSDTYIWWKFSLMDWSMIAIKYCHSVLLKTVLAMTLVYDSPNC